MFRTVLTRQARLFTTSTHLQKGPVEAGKDVLKAVDRTVSDVAVKGIETGEQAASAIKGTVDSATGKASGEASSKSGEISGKASELAGDAKGKASELTGKAKGKASELEGEAKARTP